MHCSIVICIDWVLARKIGLPQLFVIQEMDSRVKETSAQILHHSSLDEL